MGTKIYLPPTSPPTSSATTGVRSLGLATRNVIGPVHETAAMTDKVDRDVFVGKVTKVEPILDTLGPL